MSQVEKFDDLDSEDSTPFLIGFKMIDDTTKKEILNDKLAVWTEIVHHKLVKN